MNFDDVSRIMSDKSLSADPAFEAMHLLIESIPCFDGCPLGLYYPDSATIILPPDGTKAALLHELGHRHGHYYYNDLSEEYAENYRKAYQGKKVLLYAGNRDGITLSKFGPLFQEGERGTIELAFDHLPSMPELQNFKREVLSHQVYAEKVPRFYYGDGENPFIRVEFTKGADWLMIVGASLTAIVIAGVGAIGYAIYKTAGTTPWVIPVALFGTGAALLLRAAFKEAKARGIRI